MTGSVAGRVVLTPQQVSTIRRELGTALTQLDALDHLCSIQALASRADEAINAVLYILDLAAATSTDDTHTAEDPSANT
jgi:hypothetical protein